MCYQLLSAAADIVYFWKAIHQVQFQIQQTSPPSCQHGRQPPVTGNPAQMQWPYPVPVVSIFRSYLPSKKVLPASLPGGQLPHHCSQPNELLICLAPHLPTNTSSHSDTSIMKNVTFLPSASRPSSTPPSTSTEAELSSSACSFTHITTDPSCTLLCVCNSTTRLTLEVLLLHFMH